MADGVQSPKRPKPNRGIRLTQEKIGQRGNRRFMDRTTLGTFVEQSAGGPDKPFVAVPLKRDEFRVALMAQVNLCGLISGGPFESINASIASIPLFRIGIVAMLWIIPINDINGAIRSVLEIDRDIFRVATEQLIAASMDGIKTRTFATIDDAP